jgi:hypothetical protein
MPQTPPGSRSQAVLKDMMHPAGQGEGDGDTFQGHSTHKCISTHNCKQLGIAGKLTSLRSRIELPQFRVTINSIQWGGLLPNKHRSHSREKLPEKIFQEWESSNGHAREMVEY